MNHDDDFDALVRRTMPGLLAYATWYCRDRHDASDAVQEAYLELYSRWDTVSAPDAWLRTTVRRRLIKEATSWRRRYIRSLPELELPAPAVSGVEEELEALAVVRAIRLLPPRQRRVVVLHCLDGMSYAEIATELGIRPGTVGVHLAKARERLAVLLGLTEARPGSGDPFVVAAHLPGTRSAGTGEDPLAALLRAANAWLTRGYADDTATLAHLRQAIRRAR